MFEDDDEYDDDDLPPYECDCSDAELDWEGTFHCWSCGHRWDATQEQMDYYWKAYEDYHREPTWHERMDAVMASIKGIAGRLFKSRRQMADDDIPF